MARRRRIYGRRRKRSALNAVSASSPAKFDLDTLQAGLVVGGNAPIVGNFLDAINVSISGARAAYAGVKGDKEGFKKHGKEALYNIMASVPGTQALTSVRTINKGIEIAKDVNAIRDNVNAAATIRNSIASR